MNITVFSQSTHYCLLVKSCFVNFVKFRISFFMIFQKFPFFLFSCFISLTCEMVVTLEVPLSVLDAERLGEFIGPRGVNIKSLEQKHKVSPFHD